MLHLGIVHCKKSNQSWSNSQNTIPLFVYTRLINSNTSTFTAACITASYGMRGWTDAFSLTHPTINMNVKELTLSNMIPYNIIWSFDIGQHQILQNPHKFYSSTISRQTTYLCTLTSTCILLSLSNISWIPYFFTLSPARLNLHVQTISFVSNASLRTHALAHFFMLGLKQLSVYTLTHVFWYKLLPVARSGVCKKVI